jgi:hypothetical protein
MSNIKKIVIKICFTVPDELYGGNCKIKNNNRTLWYKIQGNVCIVYLTCTDDDRDAFKWACNELERKGILGQNTDIKLIYHRKGNNRNSDGYQAHAYKEVHKTNSGWSQKDIDDIECQALFRAFCLKKGKR